jgi:hypothetical protein
MMDIFKAVPLQWLNRPQRERRANPVWKTLVSPRLRRSASTLRVQSGKAKEPFDPDLMVTACGANASSVIGCVTGRSYSASTVTPSLDRNACAVFNTLIERSPDMKRVLGVMALAIPFASFALPSLDEVQAEVQRGDYAQAESAMREVVKARPDSVKAHSVHAGILAHNRRFDQAAQKARLASNRHSSLPGWVWPLGGAAIALLLSETVRAMRQSAAVLCRYASGGGSAPVPSPNSSPVTGDRAWPVPRIAGCSHPGCACDCHPAAPGARQSSSSRFLFHMH